MIFVCYNAHCVRSGNYRVLNFCCVLAERHGRLHAGPQPMKRKKEKATVTFPVSQSLPHLAVPTTFRFAMFTVVHGSVICAPTDRCLEHLVEGKNILTCQSFCQDVQRPPRCWLSFTLIPGLWSLVTWHVAQLSVLKSLYCVFVYIHYYLWCLC